MNETVEKSMEQVNQSHLIYILHLSDIHLGTVSEAKKYCTQLKTDLDIELKVAKLDYIVLSGDIANHSTDNEYNAAAELINGLRDYYKVDNNQIIIVPGNHDMNRNFSEKAYKFVFKSKLSNQLSEEYIPAGDAGALLRDENLYKCRFTNFSDYFYKKVCGMTYPLEYAKQGILHPCSKDRILFLMLNSSWELDHYFSQRASINMEALSSALSQLHNQRYDDWLKIAVWHHPVTGRNAMNNEFLQLLTIHGFRICMHGHIHEASEGFYNYDHRGIHIIGAGTFGAPTSKQVPGIPLQYNLLILNSETSEIFVETRKKEKPDGAWSHYSSRWGNRNKLDPWYTYDKRLNNPKDPSTDIHVDLTYDDVEFAVYCLTNQIIKEEFLEWNSQNFLFGWKNLSENNSERLKKFLKKDLRKDWVENAKIEKLTDRKIIRIFTEKESIEIMLDENNKKVMIKTSDGEIYHLLVKEENHEFNIYRIKYDLEKNIIIGVDRGGAIVGGMLAKNFGIGITTLPIYYAGNISPVGCIGNINFSNVRKILLVDDAIRTGRTMEKAAIELKNVLKCKENIDYRIACLLWDPSSHKYIKPDFCVYQSNVYFPWDNMHFFDNKTIGENKKKEFDKLCRRVKTI